MGQLGTQQPPLYILSGPREVGKTTFLRHLLTKKKSSNLDCAGVLSPAVFENGQKTGIDLLDVRSGAVQKLANLRHNEQKGIFTERWMFEAESLSWGNEILGHSTPCDLLIVDELGPIELERGQGWQAGITALNSGLYLVGIVVIRPELLRQAYAIWPNARLITLTKDQNPEKLQAEILTNLA
jgi:nucleoside-triphosphatase THEP1